MVADRQTRPELGSLFTFNCAGSFVHHQLGAPKQSPLVGNLFLSWRQYVGFLGDLPRHIAAEPSFDEPRLGRYAGAVRLDYPVSHHGEAEIHWIHSRSPESVLKRYRERSAAVDWANVVVSFSEANFGESPLSGEEWSEFAVAWNALPYRKVFLATGRYPACDGLIQMGRWRGLKHEENLCGVDVELCKPSCPGCRRPSWGGFVQEGTWIIRALNLEDQINPPGPFGKIDIAA